MTNSIIIALIVGIALLIVFLKMSHEPNDAAARQVSKRRTAMAISVTVGAAVGAAFGVAREKRLK